MTKLKLIEKAQNPVPEEEPVDKFNTKLSHIKSLLFASSHLLDHIYNMTDVSAYIEALTDLVYLAREISDELTGIVNEM